MLVLRLRPKRLIPDTEIIPEELLRLSFESAMADIQLSGTQFVTGSVYTY